MIPGRAPLAPQLRLTEEAFVAITADNLRRITRGDPARIRALMDALQARALSPDARRDLAPDPRAARLSGSA